MYSYILKFKNLLHLFSQHFSEIAQYIYGSIEYIHVHIILFFISIWCKDCKNMHESKTNNGFLRQKQDGTANPADWAALFSLFVSPQKSSCDFMVHKINCWDICFLLWRANYGSVAGSSVLAEAGCTQTR